MLRNLIFILLIATQAFGARDFIGPTQVRSSAGSISSSAIFEVNSTTRGSIPCPKMSTAQRDAIPSPTALLCISNTTTGKLNQYNGSAWIEVGSGAGIANYIAPNDDAEGGTTGWATYADAAAAAPVDGTGGSPNVTWTTQSSNVLRGSNSFRLTKDAANRQGQGASYAFTIAAADKAKPLTISFEYTGSANFVAGSDSATGDVVVYVYDVTNSTLIQPTPYKVVGGTGNNWKYSAAFQTASNSTSYRLIFHVAGTHTNAWTLDIDTVAVSPQTLLYGAPETDWVSSPFTPDSTAFGAGATNVSRFCRRSADSLECRGYFTAGTVGAANAYIPMPTGYTIDTAKFGATASAYYVGFAGRVPTGAASSYTNAAAFVDVGTTDRVFLTEQSNAGVFNKRNGNTMFSSSDGVSFYFKVPVTGWSSNTLMSQDADTRVVAARYSKSSSQSISTATATDVTFNTKNFDTHAAFDTSTGKFTAPVAGVYNVSAQIEFATVASGDRRVRLYKNGSLYSVLALNAGTGVAYINGSDKVQLNAGDYITINVLQSSGGSINISGNGTDFNYVAIERITGPSAIAVGEKVQARYRRTSAQTLATGTTTIIDFSTKDSDSHGAVTTGSSWKFTAPAAGTYRVSAGLIGSTSAAWNAGENWQLFVYKNGSVDIALGIYICQATATNISAVNGSGEVNLLAGDYIDIRAVQNTGSNHDVAADNSFNYVTISRLPY